MPSSSESSESSDSSAFPAGWRLRLELFLRPRACPVISFAFFAFLADRAAGMLLRRFALVGTIVLPVLPLRPVLPPRPGVAHPGVARPGVARPGVARPGVALPWPPPPTRPGVTLARRFSDGA